MKKIILLFCCLTTFALSGCSWFDSSPVEPDIIGVGHVKFNPRTNLYTVDLDSVIYITDKVVEYDRNPRSASKTQNLPPVDGMEVTILKDKDGRVICVYGRKDEAQIEELYHENHTFVFVFCLLIFAAIVILLWQTKRKK